MKNRRIPEKRPFSTTSNYQLDFTSTNPIIESKENRKTTMSSTKTKDYKKYFPRCKESTKASNASGLKKFCIWVKNTPEQLIEDYKEARTFNNLDEWERKKANQIAEFYQHIRKKPNHNTGKPYSSNYCNTVGSAVLAFYHQNCKAIEGVMDTFVPTTLPTDEYRFTQDDLRKMYHFGDIQEKAMISLAVCYGQGAKDFLRVEAHKLRGVIYEAKRKNLDFAKWVGAPRSKTGITPISFLTPEAIESVDAYLKLLEKQKGDLPKYIWCNSKPNKPISGEGLNKRLRRLVEKANIDTENKRVRFHCIRKFTFSRLRRIDKDMAKIICAKSVSASDMTYEELEEQAEKVFQLAYRNIALNGTLMRSQKQDQEERIKKLENAIVDLSKKCQNSDTISETLTKRMIALEEELENVSGFIATNLEFDEELTDQEKQALRKKFGIREFTEKERELLQAYRNITKEFCDEEGNLTPVNAKEIDKKFQAYLKKRVENKDVDV
jgi:integrase